MPSKTLLRDWKIGLIRRVNICFTLFAACFILVITFFLAVSLASSTTNISLIVHQGSLAVSFVNGSYQSLISPQITLPNVSYSTNCQESQGILGTSTQQIYVKNPDAVQHGWVVTLAASSPTNTWTNGSYAMDFNDPTSSGCSDGIDADTARGQLTLDPSNASLSIGACSSCGVNDIILGSTGSFKESVMDSVTLVSGGASSDERGDWVLRDIQVTQKIPGGQQATGEYSLPHILSITAQ